MIKKLIHCIFACKRRRCLAQGKLIGIEILDATERYAKSDIFNLSTENLVVE